MPACVDGGVNIKASSMDENETKKVGIEGDIVEGMSQFIAEGETI